MVHIVADTTCGLPLRMLEERGIPLIPQVVIFGEESFHDVVDIDTPTFLKKLKASPSLPKTAAPEPTLYYPIFQAARASGESVIVVAPSSHLSGTVRSAEVAAQDFAGTDIRIIDTRTVSCNLGTLVLEAAALAKAGMSADEIESCIREMIPRGRLYFVVDTLEYLQKGGRIGGASALLGELIQVKPILTIREGKAEPYEKPRTRRRSLERLAEIVQEQCPKSPDAHLCVIQVAAEAEAEQLAAELRTAMNVPEVPIYELPPVVAVHGGPGAMGVGFFAKAPIQGH